MANRETSDTDFYFTFEAYRTQAYMKMKLFVVNWCYRTSPIWNSPFNWTPAQLLIGCSAATSLVDLLTSRNVRRSTPWSASSKLGSGRFFFFNFISAFVVLFEMLTHFDYLVRRCLHFLSSAFYVAAKPFLT